MLPFIFSLKLMFGVSPNRDEKKRNLLCLGKPSEKREREREKDCLRKKESKGVFWGIGKIKSSLLIFPSNNISQKEKQMLKGILIKDSAFSPTIETLREWETREREIIWYFSPQKFKLN